MSKVTVELNKHTLWDLAYVLDACDHSLNWLGRVESPRAAWEQASGEYLYWFGAMLAVRTEYLSDLQQDLLRHCVRAGVVLVRAAGVAHEAIGAVDAWLGGAHASVLDNLDDWGGGVLGESSYALILAARQIARGQVDTHIANDLPYALAHQFGYAGPAAAAQVRELLTYELLERAALPLLPDAVEVAREIREAVLAGMYADADDDDDDYRYAAIDI